MEQEKFYVNNNVIPANVRTALEQLKVYDLTGIAVDPVGAWLRLDFTSGVEGPDITIKFFNPIFWRVSKGLEVEESFFVGEAVITPISDGGKEIFSLLGYAFRDADGLTASYPTQGLFSFHLEGAMSLDVVCQAYQVLQEIK